MTTTTKGTWLLYAFVFMAFFAALGYFSIVHAEGGGGATCADLGQWGDFPNCYDNPPPPPSCADSGQVGYYPNCHAAPWVCNDLGTDAYGRPLVGNYPNCHEPPLTCGEQGLYYTPSGCIASPPQCSDGIDNDGDGVSDSGDPGCYNGTYDQYDNDEYNSPNPPPPPPSGTAVLTATPNPVTTGGEVGLSWNSSEDIPTYNVFQGNAWNGAGFSPAYGARSCSGSNFDTGGAPSGGVRVYPTVTTTYTIQCAISYSWCMYYGVGPHVGEITEANCENYSLPNGTASITVTVNAPPQPDLTASAISPTTATAGLPVTLSGVVSNIGSSATGAGFPSYFIITDGPNGSGNILVAENPTSPALAPGGDNTLSRAYTFPSAGTYSAIVCADFNSGWGSTIAESREDNNCGPWTNIVVSGASGQPDLTATTGSAASGTVGHAIALAGGAMNQGIAAAGSFPNILQVCNADCSWSDVAAAQTLSGLAVNASNPLSSAYTFNVPGDYYRYRFCADLNTSWAGSVAESNEDNNCGLFQSVTVVGSCVPDASCAANACIGNTCSDSCGNTYTGTKICPTSCSNPAGTLTAIPNRVHKNTDTSVTFTYSATGANSCTLAGPGISVPLSPASCSIPSGTHTATINVASQGVYTLSCDGTKVAQTVVNVIPSFLEF